MSLILLFLLSLFSEHIEILCVREKSGVPDSLLFLLSKSDQLSLMTDACLLESL